MDEHRWELVDEYVEGLLIGPDQVLEQALSDSAEAGLPAIAVTPSQGRLLNLLARIHGAQRILEIGTLGGYSTIWLARALPASGRLISLELEPRFAQVAERNIARARLAAPVEIRVGPAGDSLRALAAEAGARFDLVFIDADKRNTDEYFERSLELCRPCGVIVADNVVRGGALVDRDSADPGVAGMRRFLERVADEPRVQATTIQTVGAKGYDGVTLALVGSEADGAARGSHI
jgi:predicted O-methyltransferase YrrM